MSDDALRVSEPAFSVERTVPRFKFIAEAEATRTADGMRLVARLAELSAQGCYVDTQEAFPVGTALRLRIRYGGSACELVGNVIYAHSGWGMGVLFGEMSHAQRAVLDSWLTELTRKTAPRPDRKSPVW